MKLLFDGLIKNATLNSLYPSYSYPLSNLRHEFITRKYQSSRDNDTIVVNFESPSDVSSFWWGYTNAYEIIFELYDYENTLLHQEIIYTPEVGVDVIYFDNVPEASYAVIQLFGNSVDVYLGGCDCGISTEFPFPLEAWNDDYTDNTAISRGPNGHTAYDRTEPLRRHEFEFKGVDPEDMKIFKQKYIDYGIGHPLFVDPFDLNHDFMMPLWCIITRPIGSGKNGINREFELLLEECR